MITLVAENGLMTLVMSIIQQIRLNDILIVFILFDTEKSGFLLY